jgi:hypothetical protein
MTGINHLHESPELEAEDAGGIWDKEGVWPTYNICNHPFAYRVEQAPDHLEVVLDADLGNMRITKKCRLDSESTRLALEATYQNSGSIPIRTLFTHIFSLAPGGRVGSEDFVVYPDSEGFVKKRFGSRLPIGPSSVSPSWWMVSDSEQGVSLLLTFEPNPLLAERIIGSVPGAVELELHTRRHLSNPGEALTLRWDMRLIKHASDVERACVEGCFLPESERKAMTQSLSPLVEHFAVVFRDMGEHLLAFPWGFVSLSVPHRVSREPEPLEAEMRAMRFVGGNNKEAPSGTLRLELDRSPSFEFPLSRLDLSVAEIQYWRLPTAKLNDGGHSLGLAAEGRTIHTSFAAINEESIAQRVQRAGLEHAIERYLRSISSLEERIRLGDLSAGWWPLTRRPLAVSGFSYAFFRARPEGERVKVRGLEPQKLYRVAVTERVLSQSVDGNGGPGYLGWLPNIQWTAMNEIDAQEQYLQKHSPAKPAVGGRITEY